MEILLRYLHFISVITLSGTLIAEFFLLKSSLKKKEIRLLGQIDAVYGISALILLGVGLTLWLGGYGKPTEFYSENPTFHLKLGLFVLIGLISIYPTVFFIKQGKGESEDQVEIPRLVRWSLNAELILLACIPLLAGLMAKGINIF
jgi:putative membrane protein